MTDTIVKNDIQLDAKSVRQLESADQVAALFARLGYDISVRINIPDAAVLGISNEELRFQINRTELIGKDPTNGEIAIYLFEVNSVTARLRNELARNFRDLPGNVLLVLTKNYDELEFVLLERVLSQSQSRTLAYKQTVRPIALNVKRQDPAPVAVRVLKRFTFTEADSGYQWEKLRSAFVLAEWSEEYFNNRALFSDYYLINRLTDPAITPEWGEDASLALKEVYRRFTTARSTFSGKPEVAIRKGLFEPLFALLGFYMESSKPDTAEAAADYLLYAPGDKSKPIAAALTYVWNRNLDDADVSRDTETQSEIPGAKVVTLLEQQIVPWVIVTNGKLWRLYSSTASNKATNYYEVDLEEASAANDQIAALKYWWLMFRQSAFTGFLDNVIRKSADYAKELGDRLKERVFVEIFPQFAKGFIADMRNQGITDFDDAMLAEIFNGTLTFLYRAMFILYAESLELLPLTDEHGYGAQSLRKLKLEIGSAGGTVQDQVQQKLSEHYKPSATGLYDRFKALFRVIESGSVELNMPIYNGGLFSTQGAGGAFLDKWAIPDRYLALGLDKLARDIDSRTQGLVFIDFKSLGVRHLGSIYEGLLEFQLKIASEKLGVKRTDGKEVYLPVKKVPRPLATIAKGEAYLANDKSERKATGSYYTPDYIVKYIVRHTVGPVLDRKFEGLASRLHAAQKGYRDAVKREQAIYKGIQKGDNPAKFWNNADIRQLLDDCLSVRVLDPAMGSGHFLVEAVDFISNRLIDFLNAWTENPVWAYLDETRQQIVDNMEEQRVTIDADRLTRVALLKRTVLKRCIYGVDLNGMAVELAKVSLWLDAFTLGAPLSFLDHHLKQGNSLIGARVAEVQDALAGQSTLFSQSKFAGVMLATDLMRQVSYLSDNTIQQTKESAKAFHEATDFMAPYKRVLDVYTSRWFGNTPFKGKKGAPGFDPTIEFLGRDDTQKWLADPYNPKNRLPADDYMKAGLVAKTALEAVAEKRFFHWELEFPEVYFAPSTPGGRDVGLMEYGGFDAVVGNPPYSAGRDWGKGYEKDYLNQAFKSSEYQLDLYQLFIERFIDLTRYPGISGMITPDTWTQSLYSLRLRQHLLTQFRIHSLVALSSEVFPDASVDTMIVIVERNTVHSHYAISIYVSHDNIDVPQFPDYSVSQAVFLANEGQRIDFLTPPDVRTLLRKMLSRTTSVGELYETTRGINAYDQAQGQSKELIANRAYHAKHKVDKFYVPELMGSDVSRYDISWSGDHWIKYGDWLAAPRDPRFFNQTKLLVRKIMSGGRIVALVDDNNFYVDQQLYIAIQKPNQQQPTSLWYALSVISSTVTSYIYLNQYRESNVLFPQITVEAFSQFGIPSIDFITPLTERKQLTREAIGAYDLVDNDGMLARAGAALASGKSDVVHDLLAHLAERMTELNKQKGAEVNRFLGWLEGMLDITPTRTGEMGIDSLPGKTFIQGYLGDYQKGDTETSWRDFHSRLHQNRNRFAVALTAVEGEIEGEYEKSLIALLPIKRDLARTDILIDKIVYRLYGLTDAEIELIERPQYEQALAKAKSDAVADGNLDDDQRIDKIAEGILPAAQRYFERVTPQDTDATLDRDLTNWRSLPPDAPIFLQTGDYNLNTLPGHMDFSSSAIPYTKAAEFVLHQRLFEPFRNSYSADDCRNEILKRFMRRERELTLGSYMIILSSSEAALRSFGRTIVPDMMALASTFNNQEVLDIRNKAAHDEVVSRDEAERVRTWAFDVLRQL